MNPGFTNATRVKLRSTGILLFLLATLGFLLRLYLLPSHLFFGPEQGRVFLTIRDIVYSHKLTLVGPQTDLDGIFHGPLYFYIAAIPFYFSHGNPLAVAVFFIFLSAVAVVAFYRLAEEMIPGKAFAWISSILYAVSFGLSVNSRWLINPPLSVPFSVLFFYCLTKTIKGKSAYLYGTLVFFALLGQAEVINFVIFGILLLVAGIRFRKKLGKIRIAAWIAAVALGFFMALGNYILFDLRHDFLITKKTASILSSDKLSMPIAKSFFESFSLFFYQTAYSMGSVEKAFGIGMTVMFTCVWWVWRKKYPLLDLLFFWVFVPPIVLALLRHGVMDQMFVGSVAGFVAAGGMVASFMFTKDKVTGGLVTAMLVAMNIVAIKDFFPANRHIFFQAPQPHIRYTDEISVIRNIYTMANGRPFSIQTYTIPYFWQDAWTYLFWYIGQREYGYTPTEPTDRLYVIVQKDHSNPTFQSKWLDNTVSTWGIKYRTFTTGEFTVYELIPSRAVRQL